MSEIPSSVPEKPSEIKNKYEQELFLLLREKLKSRTHLFPKLKDSKSIE
jgi:predicted subunit of tRNA(5-methylaminomethyl-2-thiouridylate) methyltransferase